LSVTTALGVWTVTGQLADTGTQTRGLPTRELEISRMSPG